MPKCINDSSVSYTGVEPSPLGMGYCASGVDMDTVMIGRNGKQWISKTNSDGSLWVKHKVIENDADDYVDYRTRKPANKKNSTHYNIQKEDSINSISTDSENSASSDNNIDEDTYNGIIKFINLETSIIDHYVKNIYNKRIQKEHLDTNILKKFNSNKIKSLHKHAIYKYLTDVDNKSDLAAINETGMWKDYRNKVVEDDIYYMVLEHVTATTKFKKMDEFCKKTP